MIQFSAKDELGTTVASLLGIAILVGTLFYMLLVPMPTAKGIEAMQRAEENRILAQIAKDRAALAKAEREVRTRVWSQPAQTIGPAALASITTLARGHQVRLSGFRPQRTSTEGELELLPFVVTAEGPFPTVMSFVRAVENPSTRLAVHLLQVSSSDGSTDQVTATVGVTAYRLDAPAPAAKAVKEPPRA